MNEKLVSIIVPVYKVEQYLDRCVQSIINQTYKNLEIILVDDGSPDTCGKMCDDYAKKDKRIKVIHKQNGGLSSARNAGLDVARGEYFAFSDSDDWVDPNFIKTMYDKIEKYDADMVCASITEVIESTGENILNVPVESDTLIEGDEILQKYLYEYSTYSIVLTVAWNKLYKRKVFETLRYPVGRIYEDTAIVLKVLSNCQKIVVIPEPLYFYLKREGSIMRTDLDERKIQSTIDNCVDRIEFLLSQGNKDLLSCEIIRSFCDIGWLYRTCKDKKIRKLTKEKFRPISKKYRKYAKINSVKSIKMLINLLYIKLF